jgi:exodeoxyribonuclease VII small subunit
MATKQSSSYQSLSVELDDIMSRLQREDIDVDEAVQLYSRGMEVVRELQTYLKSAKNKVEKIKLKFS